MGDVVKFHEKEELTCWIGFKHRGVFSFKNKLSYELRLYLPLAGRMSLAVNEIAKQST